MKLLLSAAAAIILITSLVSVGHGATSLSGADLYAVRCEGCHGKITETSIIRGATSTMMEFAIKNNFGGGMRNLSGISSNDLQSISSAIADTAPTGVPSESSSSASIPSSRVYNTSGAARAAEVMAVPEHSSPAVAPIVPSVAAAPTVTTAGGSALYGSNCAGCHGPLASSSKKKVSYARIQAAIKGNVGGMGGLSTLSGTEIQSIVDALSGTTAVADVAPAAAPAVDPVTPAASAPVAASEPIPAIVTPDGYSLYASNCAFCHGPMSSSAKRGATLARIQTAISLNSGGMASLANMQATDLLSIAAAIGNSVTIVQLPASATTAVAASGSGGGTGGSALYGSNCAGCHGPLASSAKTGATTARIQGAISANTGGMGSLSSLSATDLQAIATALGGGGSAPSAASPATSKPATTPKTKAAAPASAGATSAGATLYDASCASCHGPLASSAKKGAAATAIQGAISAGTGGMGSLSSLSAADIQSIADALAGSGGGSGGGSNSCLTCHPNGMNGKMGGGEGEGKGKGGRSKGGEHKGGGHEGRGGGDD